MESTKGKYQSHEEVPMKRTSKTQETRTPGPGRKRGRRKIKIEAGQVVGVPLCDGSFGLAHIARYDLSIWCVLYDQRERDIAKLSEQIEPAMKSHPIAVMEVTSNLVEDGLWPIIGTVVPCYAPELLDTKGWSYVGTNTQFLFEAYYGLRPWDEAAIPKWYDNMLLPGVPVPPSVRYKRDFEKETTGNSDKQPRPADSAVSPHEETPAPNPPRDKPGEIHIQMKYPGEGLPSIELLHQRQALERALEETGAGEVSDAGGGGGEMDVYLQTDSILRAIPLVKAALHKAGFTRDVTIEFEENEPSDEPD